MTQVQVAIGLGSTDLIEGATLQAVLPTDPGEVDDQPWPIKPAPPHSPSGWDKIFSFGPFTLQPVARRLERDGVKVALGDRALDILVLLVQRAGAVITKQELIGYVWRNMTVDDGNLRVRLVELRRALDDPGRCETYIANVKGQGYCFVGNVEVLSSLPAPRSGTLPECGWGPQGTIEIELPSGLKVRFTSDVDEVRIRRVLSTLSLRL